MIIHVYLCYQLSFTAHGLLVKIKCGPRYSQEMILCFVRLTDQWDDSTTCVYCAASCVPVLVQQNFGGSNFFNRSWAEFKVGFSDSRGNYWLGNDLLHQLTVSGRYKLRFDLQTPNAGLGWAWAEYNGIVVLSEANNYKVIASRYTGNLPDAFSSQTAMEFTTYDRDNDWWTSGDINGHNNCAVWNSGGFWYNSCGLANVNTVPNRGAGFTWNAGYRLLSTRMMLTC